MSDDCKAQGVSGVRGRFAPSPTGELHLGHAQTMLLCWLQVRSMGGVLVLRIEDVDRGRTRPGAEEGILRDLRWLGFDWDEGPDCGGPLGPYRQTECTERYLACLEQLAHRLFECTCTRKEIRLAAGVMEDHRGELRYPGTCRAAPAAAERSERSIRVRVDEEVLCWDDLWLGPCREDTGQVCGDFILRAKNGDFTYQLACVADDIAEGITHVLRGEDLVDSTGRQILLHRWLGSDAPPLFAHTPLRKDGKGIRLAKSRGSPGLGVLREAGEDPRLLLAELAHGLGLVDEPGLALTPAELIPSFSERMPQLVRSA
ncbi:MAG: glutamate--tRNA ligase family protein [Myxococcota bacterium]|nr:glutamate--tRNA ligase family protein [Myxococcota bacterium]